MKNRIYLLLISTVLVLGLLTGCFGGDTQNNEGVTPTGEPMTTDQPKNNANGNNTDNNVGEDDSIMPDLVPDDNDANNAADGNTQNDNTDKDQNETDAMPDASATADASMKK